LSSDIPTRNSERQGGAQRTEPSNAMSMICTIAEAILSWLSTMNTAIPITNAGTAVATTLPVACHPSPHGEVVAERRDDLEAALLVTLRHARRAAASNEHPLKRLRSAQDFQSGAAAL
jgi:hypothetical protein